MKLLKIAFLITYVFVSIRMNQESHVNKMLSEMSVRERWI